MRRFDRYVENVPEVGFIRASEEDKRSAGIALAGVLEERRDLLKQSLTSEDEGALFTITNKFAIRHRRAGQSTAYDQSSWTGCSGRISAPSN